MQVICVVGMICGIAVDNMCSVITAGFGLIASILYMFFTPTDYYEDEEVGSDS